MNTLIVSARTDKEAARLYTTVGYFVAFVALGLAYAALGPTLTDLAELVGAGLTAMSYAFAARGSGYLLGSVVGGRLYDAMKPHRVMSLMLVMISLVMILIPMVRVLWLLVLAIFLLSFFQGGLDVGGNTLLVWVHREKVSPYMNALHFFFGVGAFLSPIIVAQAFLLTGGIRWAYWTLALLILPVAFWITRLTSPASPASDPVPEAPVGSGSTVTEADDRRPANRVTDMRLVALIALFFFLYVGAEGSFGGWIATYVKAMGLGTVTGAAYLTSAFWGAVTLGRLLAIPLAARFTPRQLLLGDLIGCLVSAGVLVLWPGSLVAVWVGTFGAGLAMASIFPTTLSLAEQHTMITGRVTSYFFAGGSLGGMTIPWAIGQVFESVGPRVTIFAMSVALVLDAFVFGFIVLHTRRREAG